MCDEHGRVEQHMLDLHAEHEPAKLQELRNALMTALVGVPLSQAKDKLAGLVTDGEPAVNAQISQTLNEMVDANRQEKLLVAGAANLARSERDFGGGFSTLLDAIEQQVVLLRLINELQQDQGGVSVRIGTELQADQFQNASMVVTSYQSQGTDIAKVGVIGPTRMDYSSNIAAVNAVASYLSRILGR